MEALSKPFRLAARRALERAGWLGPIYRDRERRLARDATPWRDMDDGLPTPPPLLVAKVAGHADLDLFLRQGREISLFLSGLARASSATLFQGDVLDFGCGCGRLARSLAPAVVEAGGSYTGIDINGALISWCRGALPGSYLVNTLGPPLPTDDCSFDVLFSVSVFTHLPAARMRAWLGEFGRVLRPGGLALVSFADEARARLADLERPQEPLSAKLGEEGFATSTMALEGTNFMSSYATCEAFEALASGAGFEVVRYSQAMSPGRRWPGRR